MNTPETQTETVTRTETVTETVTKAACPVCEQRVDVDELVSVELGAADDATGCCRYCAQALFGYEGEPDGADTTDTTTSDERLERRGEAIINRVNDAVPESVKWITLESVRDHRQQLVSLTVGLLVIGVVGRVGADVATEAAAQISSQDVTQFGAPFFELPGVLPLLVIVFTAWVVVKAMVWGPRP